MHLQVGGRLQLITYRSVTPVTHFSALIGYIKDEYIIVRTPVENGVPIALDLGESDVPRLFFRHEGLLVRLPADQEVQVVM